LFIGLDVETLSLHFKTHGTFQGFDGGIFHPEPSGIIGVSCDLLIPAAMEHQITMKNMHQVRAKFIAEAANGPVTPAAHDYLTSEKNVLIIPDLLINAGGVVVSYFEWLKNLNHVRFGRMNKRWEQASKTTILDIIEKTTGKELQKEEKRLASLGAEEQQIVHSGLEETMIHACHETRQTSIEKVFNFPIISLAII
jgi:glutamate dehydrogenase (NAD(P)+)